MAGGSDPRSARQRASADIRLAQDTAKIDTIATALMGLAKANAVALRGRSAVSGADRAAQQAAAEAQAAAGSEAPTDITQFFPSAPVNASSPQPGQPRGFMELMAGAGGSANALANRAVAPARQAAGTLPSAAPPGPQQGGGGGMSVNVGGQQFSAPDTMTTTRETTAPFQFDPGFYVNATTREVVTEPNVLRAGDILQAQQSQVQFDEQMRSAAANFKVQMTLRSREAAVAMANDLQTSTNAPPDVAYRAAGAYLSGQDDVASRMLAGYGTSGAAGIAAENARARLYDAQTKAAEAEAGIAQGSLYSPSVMLGLPPLPKPLTGSETATIFAGVQDDMARVFGGTSGGLVGSVSGGLGAGESEAAKASRVENIGLRLSQTGQLLVFPKVGKGAWGSDPAASLTQLPATTVFGLLGVALDDEYPDVAFRDAARATAEAYGLGTVAVLRDSAGKPVTKDGKPVTHFTAAVKDPVLQPWVDRVHRGLRNHSEETYAGVAEYSASAVQQLVAENAARSAPLPAK